MIAQRISSHAETKMKQDSNSITEFQYKTYKKIQNMKTDKNSNH